MARSVGIKTLLFIGIFLTYGYFYQGGGHNENIRLDLTRAIVEDHTTQIDRFAHNSADGISYDGHFYSGKAPGVSLLAVPSWYIFSKLFKLLGVSSTIEGNLTCYFTTWFSLGLLSAVGALFLYSIISTIFTPTLGIGVTITYALGTIAFPFSTILFGHQIVAALLLITFGIIFFTKQRLQTNHAPQPQGKELFTLFIAGVTLGFTVVTEYPSVLVVPFFFLYAMSSLRNFPLLTAMALGISVSGGVLIAYNIIAFSDPFFIPYAAYAADPHTVFTRHKVGLFGITLPSLAASKLITISLDRGIFVCNPVLLLIFPALIIALRNKKYRSECLLSLVPCAIYFMVNAGYGPSIVYAGGGASVGPRHLIPLIPFVLFLITFLLERSATAQNIFILLATYSLAIMIMTTAVEVRLPYEFDNPLFDFVLPQYLRGIFSAGLSGTFNDHLMSYDSVAFNFGKLLRLTPVTQLLPLFLLWVVLGNYLAREVSFTTHSILRSVSYFSAAALFSVAMAPFFNTLLELQKSDDPHGISVTFHQGLQWQECPSSIIDLSSPSNLYYKAIAKTPHYDSFQAAAPFSAHFSGTIIVRDNASHTFGLSADDGACLYIDKKLLINDWGQHGAVRQTSARRLEVGTHQVDILYQNTLGNGQLSLLWGSSPERLKLLSRSDLLIQE